MENSATLLQKIEGLSQSKKVLEDEARLLREQVNLLKVKLLSQQTEKLARLPQEALQQELFLLEPDEEADQ